MGWVLTFVQLKQPFCAYYFSMALKFTTSFLEDSLTLLRYYKKLAEAAIAQVTDEQLFVILDP